MTEPSSLEGPVTPGEAEGVLSALARVRDEPPPGDAASAGCLVAMVTLIAIILVPFAGQGLDLSSNQMLAIGATLGSVTLIAGAIGIFGSFFRDRSTAHLERSIRSILAEYPDGDRARLLSATLRLLDGAYVARGPKTVPSFDVQEVAAQLGDALRYVERIERFLIEREEIYGVFTEQ